jgi:mono/diheme cytochrome c family protein
MMNFQRTRATVLLIVSLMIAPGTGAADTDAIGRGRYLYEAADCSGCHANSHQGGAPAGGLGLDTPFGTFRTPNITPDKTYGIGAWSLGEFKRALRDGVGREGEYLFPVFPYTSFTRMSEGDMEDLYAYLMSLPPAAVPSKPHAARMPFNWRPLLLFWRTLFFSAGPVPPDPGKGPDWNRGNYLVHALAHCEECHTPRNRLGGLDTSRPFAGNIGGPDKQNAPNITPDMKTGIGSWSIGDIEILLKTGMTPDSDLVGSGMKAVVRGTSRLTDADRHAMAVYLKSVRPITVETPPREKNAIAPPNASTR